MLERRVYLAVLFVKKIFNVKWSYSRKYCWHILGLNRSTKRMLLSNKKLHRLIQFVNEKPMRIFQPITFVILFSSENRGKKPSFQTNSFAFKYFFLNWERSVKKKKKRKTKKYFLLRRKTSMKKKTIIAILAWKSAKNTAEDEWNRTDDNVLLPYHEEVRQLAEPIPC